MAVLLSIMGTKAYNLLCNLTAPIIPADSEPCAKTVWILQSLQTTNTVWPQTIFTFTDMLKGGLRGNPNLNMWLEWKNPKTTEYCQLGQNEMMHKED